MMQKVFKIFKYSASVYLIAAVILIFLVDGKKAALDRLNFLKGVEGNLYESHLKGTPLDVLDLREGVSFYRQLLGLTPDNFIVRGNLGFCYFHMGDYENALKQYEEAIRLEPGLYTFYFDKGMVYLALQDQKQATVFLGKSRALLPQIKNYYLFLAGHLKQQNNLRGLFVLSQLVKIAERDQMEIVENLTKEYPNTLKHNTIGNEENGRQAGTKGRVHFFTMEEAALLEGLKYAAK